MKTMIFTIAITFLSLITTAQEVEVETNFNGRHCRGDRGICSLVIIDDLISNNSKLSFNNQKLILTVYLEKIKREDIAKIYGKDVDDNEDITGIPFIMEDDLEIDQNILKSLKTPFYRFVINKGSYPVSKEGNELRIILN